MTTTRSPEIAAIQQRVADAGLIMGHVLKKAEVGKATWWRMKNGREHFQSTIDRINRAITDMIADPSTVTRRRKAAISKSI